MAHVPGRREKGRSTYWRNLRWQPPSPLPNAVVGELMSQRWAALLSTYVLLFTCWVSGPAATEPPQLQPAAGFHDQTNDVPAAVGCVPHRRSAMRPDHTCGCRCSWWGLVSLEVVHGAPRGSHCLQPGVSLQR